MIQEVIAGEPRPEAARAEKPTFMSIQSLPLKLGPSVKARSRMSPAPRRRE